MPQTFESSSGKQEGRGQYEDVLKHVDSNVPRDLFASWFEQQGNPDRANFIRLQCGEHRLTTERHGNTQLRASERDRLALNAKETDRLWKLHRKEWQAENPPKTVLKHVDWERGFPYFGTVDWQMVDKDELSKVMTNWPIQGLVVLNLSANDLPTFLEKPWVKQLRHLVLEGNELGSHGAQLIAESTQLSNLQYLNLSQCGIDEAGARALAFSKGLGNLRVLRLRGNNISLQGTYALAEASKDNLHNLWKISVRKDVNGHDPEEFYENIDEALMEKSGFTESLEGGQTWQKQLLKDTVEQEVRETTPEDIIEETKWKIFNLLKQSPAAQQAARR